MATYLRMTIPPYESRAGNWQDDAEAYKTYILKYYGPTSLLWWKVKFLGQISPP